MALMAPRHSSSTKNIGADQSIKHVILAIVQIIIVSVMIFLFFVFSLLFPSNVTARRPAFGMSTAAFTAPVLNQPEYQIASVDLSKGWIDVVKKNQVQAEVSVPIDGSNVEVRYGVRLASRSDPSSQKTFSQFEEFVQEINVADSPCESIQKINETLTALQKDTPNSFFTKTVKYIVDGDFVAQLQLVRTLRPPPSPGFSETTHSIPPAYDPDTDSFVTGPLRLELRPLVATVNLPALKTKWDIFHNVSPADARGHFLLLPTLSNPKVNWRGQVFTPNDCHDLVHLADSVRPFGSLLLGFNSVGAGASQNHIHCHCWPSPPLPFLAEADTANEEDGDSVVTGWNCYAVSNVKSIYDFHDIADGKVQCSFLKYPVFCVQLSASSEDLDLLAKALSVSLEAIGDTPYNIGFLNRPAEEEEDDDDDGNENDSSKNKGSTFVDIFVFARSKERSDVLPTLKLGISEMMGLFHAQSDVELQTLTATVKQDESSSSDERKDGPMMQALNDISAESEDDLWIKIQDNLIALDEQEE